MHCFVRAQNKMRYFGDNPIQLHGFGVGTWRNMEHFSLGVPTPDSMIRQTFTEI